MWKIFLFNYRAFVLLISLKYFFFIYTIFSNWHTMYVHISLSMNLTKLSYLQAHLEWTLYLFDCKLRMTFPRVSLCLSAACPVGYFKSVAGSIPCSVCPSNSRTSQEGSSVCECRSGFYRAANDANSSACTSELCWFVCLCSLGSVSLVICHLLRLWEPRCTLSDLNLFLSQFNGNLIPPAEKKLLSM